MSRRRRPEKREILPDPKFGDIVLRKFMNNIMLDGKKSVAEGIVYGALETIETRAKKDPLGIFHDALNNVKPGIEVRTRRVGGATYQVPVEVRTERAQALAIRWLITAARARSEKTMAGRLSGELLDAAAQSRQRGQEARGHAPHGRGQPRLLALPLVTIRHAGAGPRPWSKQSWPAAIRSTNIATSASWPTSMPARRRRPSASFIIPASPTRSARSMRAPPRWTGWSRSRSAASRSRRPRRPVSGTTTGSTSSTRRATSTSPSRSSARCACSTARSPASTASPASSRSPRPSGARPRSTTCRGCASSTSSTAPAPISRCASA